jgi:hypothetical protein
MGITDNIRRSTRVQLKIKHNKKTYTNAKELTDIVSKHIIIKDKPQTDDKANDIESNKISKDLQDYSNDNVKEVSKGSKKRKLGLVKFHEDYKNASFIKIDS